MNPTNNPSLLVIDTATEYCSAALLHDGATSSREQLAPRDHTKLILPFVHALLQERSLKLQDLDAIVFGQGPGSFTGVRISIAAAQGLAFGANLPLIGVSNLQAMAQQAYNEHACDRCLVAIDARMGEVYWGEYLSSDGLMQNLGEEKVIAPALIVGDASPGHYAGTGWQSYTAVLGERYTQALDSQVLYPKAESMISAAKAKWAKQDLLDPSTAEPVYLRNTVTWKKLPGRA
ncbi:tRNA (adenosine(37)-N6)-threonylcarbamoyltransferase complex dimerization subunit type 1 TsaB [Alginatibacterium sediminis]|uniref:tRNA threonylcarbamoyladenosine biosynthesis protein TsaB n=1 Tax=Alginatibacterium sediminis TaxID=2164068 RepID=A0A420EFZ1_9ALTE|nr:tRNA (adenosine(37)-N6)-threonylcarbamoyltransferase complex dimerization subunit type 1 TsaB [Alginatibacterium sediminis]RKF19574.1 tRNA (adenosine(37)-N6)-threonylcarbamoyltransferase complex dimerization subunit type 1 TsaB [Alginatibacterium sediminis]